MQKLKKLFNNQIFQIILSVIAVFCVSFLIMLPMLLNQGFAGDDSVYHINTIRSMFDAMKNGTFGSRITDFVAQDYGYGSQLFYSIIPSGICAGLMFVFNIDVVSALFIEIFSVLALSGIVVFCFGRRIFKSNIKAMILAIVYIFFPYNLTNIYKRFAFSEIFITLAFPLIVFGIYELVVNGNKKLFFFNFTVGYSLAIMTHLSTTIYITIFCAIFILINWKKFISERNWLIFLISCVFVLIISASYYVPVIVNMSIVPMSKMTPGAWEFYEDSLKLFDSDFLLFVTLTTLFVYIVFICFYLKLPDEKRTMGLKHLFIFFTLLTIMNSPLFAWFCFCFKPFNYIQFPFRLFQLNGLMVAIAFVYLASNINKKILKNIFIGIFVVAISYVPKLFDFLNQQYLLNQKDIDFNSTVTTDEGIGWTEDYFTEGLTFSYLHNRVVDNFFISTEEIIYSVMHYQTKHLVCYKFTIVWNEDEDSTISILNIPYELSNGVDVYGYNTESTITEKIVDGKSYMALVNKRLCYSEDMVYYIVIDYSNNLEFGEYLKNNPFEFIVKSGEADFSKFEKKNSHTYSVYADIENTARIELPTLAYKGYKVTLTNENGTKELCAEFGENGFVEVVLNDSGTINVEFVGNYVKVADIISIVGLSSFLVTFIVFCFVSKKKSEDDKIVDNNVEHI